MKNRPFFFAGIAIAIFAAFKLFAKKTNILGLKISNISGKLPTNGAWKKRPISGITDITIHHSAGPTTQNSTDFANYHISKGWPGIAYHFVIYPNGYIEQTNELDRLTWHNGYNNTQAIGIVNVGNFEYDKPTSAQVQNTMMLVDKLKRENPQIKYLNGHGEYVPGHTQCPGRYLQNEMDYVRNKTGLKKRVTSGAKSISVTNLYDGTKADN